MNQLSIETIIGKNENNLENSLSNKDIITIINDISSTCLTVMDNPAKALKDSMAITERILKEIHKSRIQDVVYGELPLFLKEIRQYILKNKK